MREKRAHKEDEGREMYQKGKGGSRMRGKTRRFPNLSKPIELLTVLTYNPKFSVGYRILL